MAVFTCALFASAKPAAAEEGKTAALAGERSAGLDEEPSAAPEPEPPAGRIHFHWAGELGAERLSIVGIPIWAGETNLVFGVRNRRFAVFGAMSLLEGRTEWGLEVQQATMGPGVALRWSPFEVGGDLRFVFVQFSRITQSSKMANACIGAGIRLGVDVIRFDNDRALYALVRPGVDSVDQVGGPWLWSGSLSLGLRL
jgi:hypothetical protein